MLDICMLGTCGMMPLPGRWLSCALLRYGSTLTLFDCGEGTQVPWKSLGWGFRQLGAICFTHMHADHVAGLPGVLFMVAHAGMAPSEAYATFNMGCGFAIYCGAGHGAEVVRTADRLGLEAMAAGLVEDGPRRILLPNEVVFESGDMDLTPRRAA